MENMLTKYELLDGNKHKSRPYCVWAKSKLYKPNLVLIFLFLEYEPFFFLFWDILEYEPSAYTNIVYSAFYSK